MPPDNQQPQNYDFIVNPSTPPKPSFLADASIAKRIILVGGIIIVLFILFSIIKGFISGPSDADLYLPIVQDQQQIISIAADASKQTSLSTKSTNSVLTVQAGMTTDQAATLTYMRSNGRKVKPKELVAKNSTTITQQLTASTEAGTIDQTYQSVMLQQLQTYSQHLQRVYKQTNGKRGHALLDNNYKSAQLLTKQLQAE